MKQIYDLVSKELGYSCTKEIKYVEGYSKFFQRKYSGYSTTITKDGITFQPCCEVHNVLIKLGLNVKSV